MVNYKILFIALVLISFLNINVLAEQSKYISLGEGIASNLDSYFPTILNYSNLPYLQNMEFSFMSNFYSAHEEVILGLMEGGDTEPNGTLSPILTTSLINGDDDYESNIYMNVPSKAISYYYIFDEPINLTEASADNPVEINFLGKNIKIAGINAGDEFLVSLNNGSIKNKKNNDYYFWEDNSNNCQKSDPSNKDCWRWVLSDLNVDNVKGDIYQNTHGPTIGIESRFVVNADKDNPPTVGGCINNLPNYLSICLDSLNVADTDYADYNIKYEEKTLFDELKKGILISSNEADGIKISQDEILTDEVFLSINEEEQAVDLYFKNLENMFEYSDYFLPYKNDSFINNQTDSFIELTNNQTIIPVFMSGSLEKLNLDDFVFKQNISISDEKINVTLTLVEKTNPAQKITIRHATARIINAWPWGQTNLEQEFWNIGDSATFEINHSEIIGEPVFIAYNYDYVDPFSELTINGHYTQDLRLFNILNLILKPNLIETNSEEIILQLNQDYSEFKPWIDTLSSSKLTWDYLESNIELGTKNEDHRTVYGIIIKAPKDDLELNQLNLKVPSEQVKAKVIVSAGQPDSEILSNKFTGDTTDFSQVNLFSIKNLILGIPSYGKINFSDFIDLSDGADLDDNVNISFNKIEINSNGLPALNKSATLYLYNLTYGTPRILKDGSICPSSICNIIGYLNGILIFNVTEFSSYSAEENPIVDSSNNGGGSSGGGGNSKLCMENWECSEWSGCSNGYQSRICVDENNCGTSKSRPLERESCEIKETFKEEETITGKSSIDDTLESNQITGAMVGNTGVGSFNKVVISILIIGAISSMIFFIRKRKIIK